MTQARWRSPTIPEPDSAESRVRRASPYWGDEVDVLELGFNDSAPYYSDEASAIEHRLCRANGLTYGCPPRHRTWDRVRDA